MIEHTVEFAVSLPPAFNALDLLDPEVGKAMAEPMARMLDDAQRGDSPARVMMLRSLVAVTEKREPLAAGLTVMLADAQAPISSAPLHAEDLDGADISAISLPVGQGLRIRSLHPSAFGELPIEALRVQYLIQTEHGLLTINFDTPQAAETEGWEKLFDAMAQTATLLT